MIVSTKPADFADRLREFRTERITVIQREEVLGESMTGARLVLHIVPETALEEGPELDFSSFKRETDLMQPMSPYDTCSVRYNFDGLLCSVKHDKRIYSYVQLFRNGVVEAVDTSILQNEDKQKPTIPSPLLEDAVLERINRSLKLLKEFDIEAPLFIMLSLLGVKGFTMGFSGVIRGGVGSPVDRNDLLVPALRVDDFAADMPQLMRPAFDRIWNAAGWLRSNYYDKN